MSNSATGEIPPDVHDLLYEYWLRRDDSRWTMTTKEDPISPLNRLCAELNEARVFIENYRDELVRSYAVTTNRKETSSRVAPLQGELKRLLIDLFVAPSEYPHSPGDGRWLVDDYKRTHARFLTVHYAHLPPSEKFTDTDIQSLLLDIKKLTAIAVGLKDAEAEAKSHTRLIQDPRNAPKRETVKDQATAWLIQEWRRGYPGVTRYKLARWIVALGLESGTANSVDARLRQAEARLDGRRTRGGRK